MTKLNLTFLFSISLIFFTNSFPQNESVFTSELFGIVLTDNQLLVKDNNGNEIYSRDFLNPDAHSLDLDGDAIDEFLIKDKIESDSSKNYFLYIYNLLDTFYLAGEINSGVIEPYEIFSEEIEGLIIVSGNNDFSYLNKISKTQILPINCWRFEDGELFLADEELYEIFMEENDNHLSVIYAENINDCYKSSEVKSLLASAYINYMNAGETATAENFLNTFYLCEDIGKFKEELINLFNMGNYETELE